MQGEAVAGTHRAIVISSLTHPVSYSSHSLLIPSRPVPDFYTDSRHHTRVRSHSDTHTLTDSLTHRIVAFEALWQYHSLAKFVGQRHLLGRG